MRHEPIDKATSLQSLVDRAGAASAPVGEPIAAPIHMAPDGEMRHRRKILKYLDENPPAGGAKSLHMGVAGYFNFDIISKTRPQNVLLMDANVNQQRFWQELFQMMAEQATPEGFADALATRQIGRNFICADGTQLPIRFSDADAMSGLDVLKDTNNYRYFHELAAEGRAAFTTVNLVSDKARCNAIGTALRGAGYQTDTAYWSNIGTFFHPSRHGVVISRHDDDMFGHAESPMASPGLNYKNMGFYRADRNDTSRWMGYASQEERNAMPDAEVPAYEHFLENTSMLGGQKTLNMYSHASDRLQNIKRYPLILSEGPLRRTPEQIAQRAQQRDTLDSLWQDKVEPVAPAESTKMR